MNVGILSLNARQTGSLLNVELTINVVDKHVGLKV